MPRLRVRDVRKSFGATRALSHVDLDVEPGEVHAVLGENGAGKSTLMGILGGSVAPDHGTMELDGAPYRPTSPREARQAGVSTVHQELSLCSHLTVEENLLLGVEPTRFGVVDVGESRRRARAALERVGAALDETVPAHALSPAAQQLVEIARAVAHDRPRLLILDEPTSSLGAEDAERLFALVASLRNEGLAILYISHFLEEVERIADRFTVLRDGASVGSGRIGDVDLDGLVAMMAGRSVERIFPKSARTKGPELLSVTSLAAQPRPLEASLRVHRGEVFGIAGLVGAGRSELLRAIFGLAPVLRGDVKIGAFQGPFRPRTALESGAGLLSEDRKHEGLALARSIEENVTLSKLPTVVRARAQREIAERWVDRLGIKCASVDAPVAELSGGNQQKVALARLLHHDVDLLLLDEPTRGIDVRSKAQIYELIDRLATEGPIERRKAIVVVSSWLQELLGVCDRIAVMRRGRLGAARLASEWTEHALLREAVSA